MYPTGSPSTENTYGRVVSRDAPAFATAIRALLASPPDPAAVRRGAEGFTWEANTAALYAHLSGLAGRA